MDSTCSNEKILEQLRSGSAQFEVVSPCIRPVLQSKLYDPFHLSLNRSFFARIGLPFAAVSSSNSSIKVERYAIQRVTGDGRCMFRALVKGMARNKGINLTSHQERVDADDLRAAVKEIICDNEHDKRHYKEAVTAITVDEPLHRYCQRIGRSDFWGGESELLVLSKLCKQRIIVYIPESEHKSGNWGSGFIPIAEYGANKSRQVVRLLYSGRNHYDLLV
ncbi:unnamed protein product [Amaranthus hypochondriacus]